MSTNKRPIVKRQYGSRKSTVSSSSNNPPSSSSSSSSPYSSTSSSSSPLRNSRLSNTISSTLNSEWEAAVLEESNSLAKKGEKRERGSTPPTSDSLTSTSERQVRATKRASVAVSGQVKKTTVAKVGGGGDLRSFFARTSPPRKKQRRTSPELSSTDSTTNAFSTFPKLASSSSSSSNPPAPKPKLSQLYLDPFDTPGHSTLSCPTCSLSYSRTPQDINFHEKHHKKVTGGIDCGNLGGGGGGETGEGKGVRVLESRVEWDGKEKGKFIMVDWAIADNTVKRRLNDVMETIDTELSSTSLTPEQLSESKLFLFVTRNRKVVAGAVVQRIKEAYRVVLPHKVQGQGGEEGAKEGQGGGKEDSSLIKFGDEGDSGAVFCSPDPLPTLLGVHRIWTSTSSRRNGLASRLLDHVATSFLYACPISKERRKEDVAFSQPTGKGKELAKRWTGTDEFKVFVD